MKKFVCFYRTDSLTGELRQTCGSMATIQVDGRLSRTSVKALAQEHAKRHGYQGFQLQTGDCIRTMHPLELWVHKV